MHKKFPEQTATFFPEQTATFFQQNLLNHFLTVKKLDLWKIVL
jgi:hypothetical protein